nr:reverse transcriptase domain-containing protein [Tanacetum cinerariifolium]
MNKLFLKGNIIVKSIMCNTIANPRSDLNAITTRSRVSYDAPQILPPPYFIPKVVENEPEVTKDIVHPTNNGSIEDVQPLVVQTETPEIQISKPISEPVNSPVSSPRPNQIPSIPYPSRMQDQKLHDKANDQQLADHSISRPVRVAEDDYIKVGSFHFPADFVVVDFDADPRVPLILERSFFKTERALIDVFEEVDAFLAIEDDPTSPEVDQSYLNPEGDILLLEAFLNYDPSLPPPNQGNYMPEVRKELKICKAKSDKSSIDKPPEVELKDLPPHLKYAFLEGDDNPWVSPVHCVPKKGGFTVVENEDNELILTRLVMG